MSIEQAHVSIEQAHKLIEEFRLLVGQSYGELKFSAEYLMDLSLAIGVVQAASLARSAQLNLMKPATRRTQ